MTELPIPFTAPMILALFDRRKTMTRRALRRQPIIPSDRCYNAEMGGRNDWWDYVSPDGHYSGRFRAPYAIGDRLWVRESYFQFGHWEAMAGVRTKAGRTKWAFVPDSFEIRFDAPDEFRKGRHAADPETPAWHKRLGRFMPRVASRLTLIVESVKIERLQDISEADARAEGWPGNPEPPYRCPHPTQWFKTLWLDINGKDSWGLNPWVAAIGFRVVEANIDSLDTASPVRCEEAPL